MAESKIVGYKKIFGFVLPDWVSEDVIRKGVIGLLVVMVMLLLLIFVIWPQFETVTSRTAALTANKQELALLKSSGADLEKIKKDLTESNKERILEAMPTQYSPDAAIFSLRKISADTGVSVISYSLPAGVILSSDSTLSTGPGGEMVDFVAYPIRITVAAPVASLLTFIAKVESSLPFGLVSDLNLQEVTKLSRSNGDKNIQLVMEIRYYQSILKNVSLNKLRNLTEKDLALARELQGYNLLTLPEESEELAGDTATASGNIFGF